MAYLSPEMVGMLKAIVERTRKSDEVNLLLLRSNREMLHTVRLVDRFVERSPHLSRNTYEGGDDRICFCIDMPFDDREPGSLWLALVEDTRPSDMDYFREGSWNTIFWPSRSGVFCAVPYALWKETWKPWEENYSEPMGGDPYYRPEAVQDPQNPGGCAIGPPFVRTVPKVSVWEHLRRGLDDSSIRDSKKERR